MTTPGPEASDRSGRLRRLLDRVTQAGVVRSIGVLVGGTALAHGITAAAMPIATRLYSPADFAAAAAFSSLIGILVVASCLRFEMAIPLPEDDEEAANLLGLSVAAVVAISLAAGLAIFLLPTSVLALLGQPGLIPHMWLLSPALLIGGLYLALQMWFVRRKAFGPIARSRVMQSASAAAGQLGLGAAGVAPLGLLVGQMLNYGAGAATLGAGLLWRERGLLRRISLAGMARAAAIHHRFPRYSVGEALANAASIHLPVLLIAALAAGPEAGYLTLAVFLLQAPMALVGQAVGQVYLSDAPEAHREGRLGAFTGDMLQRLARLSAAPIAFLAGVSPAAFGLVFGQDWTRSGVLVAWMAPWFFFQFLASPVSTALHVAGRQRTALALQAAGLAIRVGAVIATAAAARNWTVEAYAVSGLVFYAVYLAVVLHVVGADRAKLLRVGIEAAVLAVAGALLALPAAIALSWFTA
ncbi:lipopolysaccharide biosynthesis protein [Brevundimonas sp.]|uniref:lipopolysaccharide biosynthesis protein n=1 Tax=Brevundimonas sp. TaxID=1871086 RepID=UPI002E147B9E|nr:oligosaccharide flippase family protein [Brevundimonas sp.]